MTARPHAALALLLAFVIAAAGGTYVRAQVMDLRQASGVPLPANDLPVGSVSVRVVRGSFANNLAGVDVTFVVDGKSTVVRTDANGRAQVSDLPRGAHLQASATVGAEQLQSQAITIADTGVRFVLVASADAAAAPAAASAPPVPGAVTFGPQSRIVADYSNEQLNVYYALQILNAKTSPVDIGGPLVVTLPTDARGATVMEGSSPQAKADGARVVVIGPFAPGATVVNVAFEMPYDGPTAHIQQRWPVATEGFGIFALKTGDLDLVSSQIAAKQSSVQQGQPLVMGLLPALSAGQTLTFDITGLPHHVVWPRYTALGAAGAITTLGLWAAFLPGRRRRA